MAGLGSEAVHYRGQAEAAQNQQARQQVSAQTIDTRGARATRPHIAERDTPLGRWAKELMSRTHRNVAIVALANKLARITWAVLQRRKPFDAKAVSVAA